MIKKTRRHRKYFNPQNDNSYHKCDHEGCTEAGEYRAPKDRNLQEYYWFCLKHVQEYNARWNYYKGVDCEKEEELHQKFKRFRFSSNIKYNFGFDASGNFEFIENPSSSFSIPVEIRFTAQERQCLKILEIDLEELNVATLKKQYKKMAKKFHPDINQNNKDFEEKFKLISTAYKSILNKIL